MEELRPSSGASRCRPSPPLGKPGQGLPLGRDQGVGHVLAGSGRRPASSPFDGPVVGRSFRLWTATSTRPVGQRPLDLLGEQAGPADRGQGGVPVAVPLGPDLDQLDRPGPGDAPEAGRRPTPTAIGRAGSPWSRSGSNQGPLGRHQGIPSARATTTTTTLDAPARFKGPGRRPAGRARSSGCRRPAAPVRPSSPGRASGPRNAPRFMILPARSGRPSPGPGSPRPVRSRAGRTFNRERPGQPDRQGLGLVVPPGPASSASGAGPGPPTGRPRPRVPHRELAPIAPRPPSRPAIGPSRRSARASAQAEVADRPLVYGPSAIARSKPK